LTSRTVPPDLFTLLRCPLCSSAMDPDDAGAQVRCRSGHRFAMDGGYLDTTTESAVLDTTTTRTFESFGYEWTTFDDVRHEDEGFAEIYFRDLDLTILAGKRGLDAGCGKGRFTKFLAPHLNLMVALDGSEAVEAAVRNLGHLSNVVVVKADLRSAPFAPDSFDFISCLGVLHHLDDPRRGFERLVSYLAPGGIILLYLYSRPDHIDARSVALSLARQVRRITTRLPHRVLRILCTPIAAALYVTVVLPGRAGERFRIPGLRTLPMFTYRHKPFRSLVLDTFDRLSAPVEYRYTWPELSTWFEPAGLVVDHAREEAGWFVVAHRPPSSTGP
jgi:SAM-dependent methyltransferase